MTLATDKALLERHTMLEDDPSNISNRSNNHYFAQLLFGNTTSPALEYLLDLGCARLNDVRSISQFNEVGFASVLREAAASSEIDDDSVVRLERSGKGVRAQLRSVLSERRSRRRYASAGLERTDVGRLLDAACAERAARGGRPYASGGGLNVIRIGVVPYRVRDIETMSYRYQPVAHSLLPVGPSPSFDELVPNGAVDEASCAAVVLFEYDLSASFPKYGDLGLLNALVEVGAIVQNLQLVGRALGIDSCPLAAYSKSAADRAMGGDGVLRHVVLALTLGIAEGGTP